MNHQEVSSLPEKEVTVEKATADQKLNMNHHCLGSKQKANAT